jgi:hypothetical protein
MNIQDLSNCLLSITQDASGHPLLESVLTAQVNSRLRPKPDQITLDAVLIQLRAGGYLATLPNDFLASDQYWILTEKGAAWIAAH